MRILVVEDDRELGEVVANFLQFQLGHQVTVCTDGSQALELFSREPFPLVISDIRMPVMDGIELTRKLKAVPQGCSSDIILVTGFGDMGTAVAALRAGAYDYLIKPVDLVELGSVVDRVAEHQSLLKENRELTHQFEEKVAEVASETESKLRELQKAYAEIVGIGEVGIFSQGMRQAVSLARRFHNDRSIPVLIEGETGTGKEIITRLVHYGQGEVTSPFVSLNCTAISANLFESELFGYEGGAFSGAKQKGQMGKLELAQGGTLFLDEIGDMPLELQPKLLRVLEERQFYRVGGVKKIKLDLRVICAANQPLSRLVRKGKFRKDLFYRLNTGIISLPPLRDRPEAIAPLAKLFLKNLAEQKKSRLTRFQPASVRMLENHSWPGNIRELQNVIERLVLMTDDTEVKPEHLDFLNAEMDEVPEEKAHVPLRPESIVLPTDSLNLKEINNAIMRKTLLKFNYNKTAAADYLGLSRSAFTRKVQKLD
ncbi:MAG: sigma-54 dependent transcriptional regulator [Gemmatimonadota bacterium]|nr:sigma-54 dependent transcriptional regulator [Gemmatimonadota bacterium]